jgi:hypothetical protein
VRRCFQNAGPRVWLHRPASREAPLRQDARNCRLFAECSAAPAFGTRAIWAKKFVKLVPGQSGVIHVTKRTLGNPEMSWSWAFFQGCSSLRTSADCFNRRAFGSLKST